MALELNQLTGQVDAMGRELAGARDATAERTARAKSVLVRSPEVTDDLRRKIARAREVDPWRRGAVPLGDRLDERRAPGAAPAQHTLIGADGSQIYPDRQAIATYYLVNTGAIVMRCGSGAAPATLSRPELVYAGPDLFDVDGAVRSKEEVDLRRGRKEIALLAELAEEERAATGGDLSAPIICLVDGPLLPWIRTQAAGSRAIDEEVAYFAGQFERLRRARAVLIGYVDRPGSAFILRILELIDAPLEGITREMLRQGPFRQLVDRLLFDDLGRGQRTGLFEPNTAVSQSYKALTGERIAFAYANISRRAGMAAIARLEMPGWVADDPAGLDIAQAAISANCEPEHYPYVLARAHELAVVSHADRAALEEMLLQAMLKNGMMPEVAAKAIDKRHTRRRR